ncbi:hypothetical protein lbkm_2051 [Lachnospiraceae bacterium KM106-2]|nr:hypothetical protein lbkm_2051 [Lachnospiraceae bacterium KM106-2]
MEQVKMFFNREWDKADKTVWTLFIISIGILLGIVFGPRKGDIRIGCDNDNHAAEQDPRLETKQKSGKHHKNKKNKKCKCR